MMVYLKPTDAPNSIEIIPLTTCREEYLRLSPEFWDTPTITRCKDVIDGMLLLNASDAFAS